MKEKQKEKRKTERVKRLNRSNIKFMINVIKMNES